MFDFNLCSSSFVCKSRIGGRDDHLSKGADVTSWVRGLTWNALEYDSDSSNGEQFTFFYTIESPFSQFHPCIFAINGITFNCAEQFMMYSKAVLFGDEKIAQQILKETSPLEMKKLGQNVINFEPKIWNKNCVDIVTKGNTAKFSQNPDLLQALFATKGTTLVEASPGDTIWGIGLSATSTEAQSRDTWRGKNLLGEALTEIREKLMAFDI